MTRSRPVNPPSSTGAPTMPTVSALAGDLWTIELELVDQDPPGDLEAILRRATDVVDPATVPWVVSQGLSDDGHPLVSLDLDEAATGPLRPALYVYELRADGDTIATGSIDVEA